MLNLEKKYAIKQLKIVREFVKNSVWIGNLIKKHEIIEFIDKQIRKIKREKNETTSI